MERNDEYLENRLFIIIKKYFSDIKFTNQLFIRFGKRSRRQLGCIRRKSMRGLFDVLKKKVDNPSIITITGYFKDIQIPEYVIDATIGHELVHYVHGFQSPLKKIYKHPHKGNIVKKELYKRGFNEIHDNAEIWLKENWSRFISKNYSK